MNLFQNKAALFLGVALLVVGAGSMVGEGTRAIFTDTATSGSNTFSTGVVDLELANTVSDSVTGTVTFSSNMVPADVAYGPTGGLQVENENTTGKAVTMRYAVESTVSGSGPLAKRLDLVIGKRATTGTCNNTSTFGITEAAAADWIVVYQGDLANGDGTALKLIGDKATGATAATGSQQSGDRPLTAAQTEFLCFKVTFKNAQDGAAGDAVTGEKADTSHNYNQDDGTPANDDTYQGLTADITFTFYAEQTINN